MKKFGGLLLAGFVIMGTAQAADSKAKPRPGKTKSPSADMKAKPAAGEAKAKPATGSEAKAVEAGSKSTEGKTSSHALKYGMAGCGLGSLLIHTDEKGPQIGAWFLNMSGYQTFALSFGTSNCVEGRSDVAAMEQSVYVVANLTSLSKEAAQGSGDHLNGLAEVLGCLADAEKLRFGTISQEKYDTIFAQQDPGIVLDNYLAVVKADPILSKDCSRAG
ncbi:MAG: DUF3015 family protein [Proteobacteria bacterium]|nr:DUF3015 family protein [Pseudomonadota bacterium]